MFLWASFSQLGKAVSENGHSFYIFCWDMKFISSIITSFLKVWVIFMYDPYVFLIIVFLRNV